MLNLRPAGRSREIASILLLAPDTPGWGGGGGVGRLAGTRPGRAGGSAVADHVIAGGLGETRAGRAGHAGRARTLG